jgi:hypothetical protein
MSCQHDWRTVQEVRVLNCELMAFQVCTKCGVTQHITRYYRHNLQRRQLPDGSYHNICLNCGATFS